MKNRIKYITLILQFIFSAITFAQFPNIFISSIATPNEPSIYINPKNTNHIVAAANINSLYESFDAGYTWVRKNMTSSFGVWGDPCIITDTTGTFYYFHLSNTGGTNGWIDRIVCQKQNTAGGTWTNGVGIGLTGTKDQDKEWAVTNHLNNEIYVTWTQFDSYGSQSASNFSNILFSKSTNNGTSFSAPIQLNELSGDCIDEDMTTEGAVPCVGPNGEIYVSWSYNEKIYFDKSVDGGNTWLANDVLIATQPGGWDFAVSGTSRANGLPITACDISSSTNNGNIYVNWTDQRSGTNNTDVFIAKSTDGGNTWQAPQKVNTDTTNSHQFFSWMTIDQSNGYIYIVFYDRRNYSTNSDSTDVYLAVSKDGAQTFKNVKISSTAFVPTSQSFFGDYTNISAHDGVVRPIWARMDNGATSIYTAIVDTLILNSKLSSESLFELDECESVYFDSYPYIAYKLRKNSVIDIVLYDVLGKQVAILKQKEITPYGKYLERIDKNKFNLKNGIYICMLKTDDKIQVKKIVIE